MRFLHGLLIAAILALPASHRNTKADLSQLEKSRPHVKWDVTSAITADVTCDGKPDTVVLGIEENNVCIGVISEPRKSKPQILSFPISEGNQSAFCAFPKRIETSPLDCDSGQGPLPGCKPVKGCMAFTVIDDECDPFNFYWDSSRKSFVWWRN